MPRRTVESDFVAVDVETANAGLASICQIGVVTFEGGEIRHEWSSLVDPQDYFDAWNVSIHGIDQEAVIGAPNFGEISDELACHLNGRIAVCHTHFDRAALARAALRCSREAPACRWLDSARLVRATWSQFEARGYGLANVCQYLGIPLRHHDALEDARAAGRIVLRSMASSGRDLHELLDWLEERRRTRVARVGDPAGLFYGETAVFTGALSISRRTAAALAANAGCAVANGVTTSTTLLIVGDQDLRRLAGHEKSSKHRRAEELRADGQPLRIVGESDFVAMLTDCGLWSGQGAQNAG